MTNHPSDRWSEEQKCAALSYGKIEDIPFPQIDPILENEEIDRLVDDYALRIERYNEPTVLLMGEMLFTYRLVTKLKATGIRVMVSCSRRNTVETVLEGGTTERKSIFEFVTFKEY